MIVTKANFSITYFVISPIIHDVKVLDNSSEAGLLSNILGDKGYNNSHKTREKHINNGITVCVPSRKNMDTAIKIDFKLLSRQKKQSKLVFRVKKN